MKTPTAPFLKRRVRTFSPVPPGRISVVLLSNSGRVPLAGVKYRIKVSPDCTLSGTTSTAGLISHSPVPQGTYGMEVEGVVGEVLVPAFPREVMRPLVDKHGDNIVPNLEDANHYDCSCAP